ncbi:MAG: hypothetical protein HQK75_12080 [Candidatus Magnetomorum sp.]|nr:hypothetical protein [Candidatus Magnetomorum sp.]
MKKIKRYQMVIYLTLGCFSALFPIEGFTEVPLGNTFSEACFDSCIDDTTDILLYMRNFAAKLIDETDQTHSYLLINQIFNAFLIEYDTLNVCQEFDIYKQVKTMLRKIDLKNRANAVTAIHLIDEALIKLYQQYPNSENESVQSNLIEMPFQTVSYTISSGTESKPNISIGKTIDELSNIVQDMLDTSVLLVSDMTLKKERLCLEEKIYQSAQQCMQKGSESDNPFITNITRQFTSIKIDQPEELVETIHFLDHTLRLLSCLDIFKPLSS